MIKNSNVSKLDATLNVLHLAAEFLSKERFDCKDVEAWLGGYSSPALVLFRKLIDFVGMLDLSQPQNREQVRQFLNAYNEGK